jgi:hypothetical protein
MQESGMKHSTAHRVLLETPPFAGYAQQQGRPPWEIVAEWPGRWLELPQPCGVAVFRLQVTGPLAARFHVTADERYELYLDGRLIERGPERGDGPNWFFESFDLALTAGEHAIEVRVWALGQNAPWAQISVRPGFVLVAEGEAGSAMSTGQAHWTVRPIEGITWQGCSEEVKSALGCGPGFIVDCASLDQGVSSPARSGELPAKSGGSVFVAPNRHFLRPAMLPGQIRTRWAGATVCHAGDDDLFAHPLLPVPDSSLPELRKEAELLVNGNAALCVPPGATRRIIVDLGDYVCHYPAITIRHGAGAVVRLRYAESLWQDAAARSSGGYDKVACKVFRGLFDEIHADGREHSILIPWWRCGRFVQLEIKTAAEPLEISQFSFTETRYDIGPHYAFESSDESLSHIMRVSLRTLQMCAHETYMDCPYYEQLQYVGDTRLQMLCGYLLSPDDRLQRKALLLMDASRTNQTGLVLDAYPGQGKLIPPFALWWIGCLHDFARRSGDRGFVQHFMAGAREVMERFLEYVDGQHLLVSPPGWNYVDVAEGFEYGVPPGGQQGQCSGVLQLQMVCALSNMADLEQWLGDESQADRWRTRAEEMIAAADKHYWCSRRELFADGMGKAHFSQHAQVLAIMTGLLHHDRSEMLCKRLLEDATLAQCNIYFSHYLMEVLSAFGHVREVRRRFYPHWAEVIARGVSTFPEHFGTTRSECHAWGAHLLYHYTRHVLGYSAPGWGGNEVVFDPHMEEGEEVRTCVAHRLGMIEIHLACAGGLTRGTISPPAGVVCRAPAPIRVQ